MNSASERLKALKQQSAELYESTLTPANETGDGYDDTTESQDCAATALQAAKPEARSNEASSWPGWPMFDTTLFDDLTSARVFYWDPFAEDNMLQARLYGKIVVEIQPSREGQCGLRLWAADDYRFTAKGRVELKRLGFLVKQGCCASRTVSSEALVDLVRQAVAAAEQDMDDKVQRLAGSMMAQELHHQVAHPVEWLSPFQDNLEGVDPHLGIPPELPLHLSSAREVPVLKALLHSLANPSVGHGVALLPLSSSLPSNIRSRDQIYPLPASLRETTLVDFIRKNRKSWHHRFNETECCSVEVRDRWQPRLSGPWSDWETFHRERPGYDGVIWLSRAGFSQFGRQAFLTALMITDQRLASRDNAGKSTRASGLQVMLERCGEEWQVLDWSLVASPPRKRTSRDLSLDWDALRTLPGFEVGDGESPMSLLSDLELIVGKVKILDQEVVFTTVGMRIEERLYEYPDLVVVDNGLKFALACPYDELYLPLGVGRGTVESLLYRLGAQYISADGECGVGLWRTAYQENPLRNLVWKVQRHPPAIRTLIRDAEENRSRG